MEIVKIDAYKALDGKIFNSENECELHEEALNDKFIYIIMRNDGTKRFRCYVEDETVAEQLCISGEFRKRRIRKVRLNEIPKIMNI